MISQELLDEYAAHLKASYVAFHVGNGAKPLTATQQNMIDSFRIDFEVNRVYIKVVRADNVSRSAHSFIVQSGDKKFPLGTILKANGWAAPSRNFARGNVLTKEWKRVHWAGA